MQARGREEFVALDGLRGLAAAIVVQRHGADFLGGIAPSGGYLPVDLFFLMSGFVLAHAYDHRLDASMGARRFMVLRLVRLYPLYLIGLLLIAGPEVLHGRIDWVALTAALFFLPANFAWLSLPQELFVNAAFAGFHRRLSDRVLLIVAIVMLVALLAIDLSDGSLNVGYGPANWWGGFPRAFFSFPVGVFLYRHRLTLAQWAPSWSAWPGLVLTAGLVLFPCPDALIPARDLVLVCIGFPAIVLFVSRAQPSPPSRQVLMFLGAVSYPLYVTHMIIIQLVGSEMIHFLGYGLASAGTLVAISVFAGLIIVSAMLDRLYDRPVRSWLMANIGRLTSPKPSALTTPPA